MQRASAWAGQRVKQAPAHSAPAAPTLEIFVDPELQVGVGGWRQARGSWGQRQR